MNQTEADFAENARIADMLREAAALLEAQGANPFRVSAYRNAAAEIAQLPRAVRAIFDEQGADGLEELPRVGRGIASAIAEMLITGRWSQLERLRGTVDAVQLFQSIPGIGPELAERIHVVTETRGPLAGMRVVRGCEAECKRFYAAEQH